jgi:hypothetical protein
MKVLFTLLLCITLSPLSHAKKYYTLTNGNWNNTTNVWSLNNSTPCGCFPGYTINLDTVTVNHPVSLTGTVNSSALGRIRVNASGAISSTVSDIFVNNSVVLAYGAISVRSLNVGSGGLFSIQNASVFVNLNLDNYGSIVLDHAAINQLNGNMAVYTGATFQLTNGAYYKSLLGNLKNEGTVQICASCCMELQKGNITNQSSAKFLGDGAVNVTNGIIKNLGNWASTLSYCSSGADQGMPVSENCIKAKQICLNTNMGLPTTLVSFDGRSADEFNYLEWRSASETFQEMYLLERSNDGTNWQLIYSLPVTETIAVPIDYSYIDSVPIAELLYYRLSKQDVDGSLVFRSQLSIKNSDDARASVFPNPTDSDVIVRCKHPHDFRWIELFDASGRSILVSPIEDEGTTSIRLPEEKGNYYLQLHGISRTTVFTIMKY